MRTFWLAGGAVAIVLVAFVAWATLSPAEPQAAPGVSSTEKRQRELLESNLGQAGDPILGTEYAVINAKHFKDGLPAIPVRWEPRLAEVGTLSGGAFTLEGMFGHVGKKAVILLNPALQRDRARLRRALCHEMVHAQLYALGQASERHGPAFQGILRRLSAEGAFEGIVATDEDRANLKSWLDAEAARLDGEEQALRQEATDVETERAELETARAALSSRLNTNAPPDPRELAAFNTRRDQHNWRISQAQSRANQDREDRAHFNREVERYNLMLVYPDGIDEGSVKVKK